MPISHKKRQRPVFNGAFDKKIDGLVRDAGSGKSSRRVKMKEWLNQCREMGWRRGPVIEEEFSLEELMGDDL